MLRFAILGRTDVLMESARALLLAGHKLVLVATNPAEPEYTTNEKDFAELAVANECPFICVNRLDPQHHLDLFRQVGADIGISVNWKTIVVQKFIDVFRLGILNAHGGDLPRYRGNACQAWALLAGEPRIGLCVHKMIGGELDAGDIVARDYISLNVNSTITHVLSWIVARTPSLFLNALHELERDPGFVLVRQSVNPMDALRCFPRRPEDGEINWSNSALQVVRLVNASTHPYPGAFCRFDGSKLIIWSAELVVDSSAFLAVPGQVVAVQSNGVEVACGVGKLRLLEVEVDGHVTQANQVIRSIRSRLR